MCSCTGEPLYERFAKLCDDTVLRRFLTARANNPAEAKQLLLKGLEWRARRIPASYDYKELELEGRTGKMRVSGLDRHGRAVVVLDFSAQNTRNPNAHLRFTAFSIKGARSTRRPHNMGNAKHTNTI